MTKEVSNIGDSPIIIAWRRDDEYGPAKLLASELNTKLLTEPLEEWTDEWRKVLEELDLLFNNSTISKETLLFRGCPGGTLGQLLETGTMIYPAYMSTSTDEAKADEFFQKVNQDDNPVLLYLLVPSGIPMIDATSGEFSGIHEAEIILPRNLTLKRVEDEQVVYPFLAVEVSMILPVA